MKLRILFSAVLVIALALPVIATTIRFPDVPDDHKYADAVRWASDPEEFNGNPIFKGFLDGNFGPDQELTETQFVKVVDRLFDSVDAWTRAETAALLYHGFQGIRTTTTTTTTTQQPVVTTTTTTSVNTTTPPSTHQPTYQQWKTESDRIDNLIRSIEQNLRTQGNKLFSRDLLYDIDQSWKVASRMSERVWNTQIEWLRNKRFPSLQERTALRQAWDIYGKWQSAEIKAQRQYRKVKSDLPSQFYREKAIVPSVSFIDAAFYSESNGITSFDIILATDISESHTVDICGTTRRINLIEKHGYGMGGSEGNNKIRLHCPSEQDTLRLKVTYAGYKEDRYRRSGRKYVNSNYYSYDFTLIDNLEFSIPTGTNTHLNAPKLNPQVRIIEEDKDPNVCCHRQVAVEVIVGNSDLARKSTATINNTGSKGFGGMVFDTDRFRYVYGGWTIENNVDDNFRGIIQLNEPGAPTHHLTYNSQMVVQPDTPGRHSLLSNKEWCQRYLAATGNDICLVCRGRDCHSTTLFYP